MEEIETILINEEILKSFISCHRKAFLIEEEIQRNGISLPDLDDGRTFAANYVGMQLVVKVDEFVTIDGEKTAVLDIRSKTIRERHKILASFLAFIMSLNEFDMAIAIKTTEELRRIYPRKEKAERLLSSMKEVFSGPSPHPTFSFACRNCPFHNDCVKFASEKGDISMINGVGQGRKKALEKAGYSNVKEISRANPETLSKYMGISVAQAEKIVLQARSVSTSKWFLIDKNKKVPDRTTEYFFDVEKAADETYLLGVLLKTKKKTVYKYFILLEEEWEEEWENFLNFVKLHPRSPIYHYDVFDRNVIEKFGFLSHKSVKNVLNRLEDLYAIITHSFILPVRFYSLKDVARTVGFEWRLEDLNGYEAMKLLTEWKEKRDEEILEKIAMYNEDDCRALLAVKEKIGKILNSY
ncbi:TM0106 family RecB-like putative nuclease [Mesoaciditoga lauensis]|uniref:TM0106 family RecB-like putative nuclease n=1 Tax=Mesoaciditoga lauensis TaxID=1495039 RepID=UPI000569386C|nr:TM0106 family RecB-like putative nuclease [Mesoaciditoga lauensis]